MKLRQSEFDKAVKRAIQRIPENIRQHLNNVLISVKKRPSHEMMQEFDFPMDDPPLGLYVGTSMPERTAFNPPLYPDTIYIFQEPLEDMCETMEELEEEIEITVVHEIAHFIGITDQELNDWGYG